MENPIRIEPDPGPGFMCVWEEDGQLCGFGLDMPYTHVLCDSEETAHRVVPSLPSPLRTVVAAELENGHRDQTCPVIPRHRRKDLSGNFLTVKEWLEYYRIDSLRKLVATLWIDPQGYWIEHIENVNHNTAWCWLKKLQSKCSKLPERLQDGCYWEAPLSFEKTPFSMLEGRIVGESFTEDEMNKECIFPFTPTSGTFTVKKHQRIPPFDLLNEAGHHD